METNACRICLSSDVRYLSSLFSCAENKSYAELVSFSCGIDIDPAESMLPQGLCVDCASQIKSACSIKQMCLDTDQMLRQKLKSEGIDSELKFQFHNCIEDSSTTKNDTAHNMEDNLDTNTAPDFKLERNLEESSSSHFEIISESNRVKKKKKLQRYLKKQKNLMTHKNKKPEEQDYRCFICEKVFDLISAKDFHVKQNHAGERVCKICNKRKQTAIALETHLRYHYYGYRFLCSSCGKSFRFKNILENHLKVEHYNTVQFHCDMCHYSTKFKINLERHVKSVHMKLKNFKCDKCADHEYSTQVGLNLHLYRVHGVEAPVKCGDCLQGFTFESELRVHKKHCTGSKVRLKKARPQDAQVDILENGFRCRVCLQIYQTRSKWSVHYHHKHKNSNVCGICNKQMASSTSLFKHIQVQHNNIKKFQCEICLKSFGFKHSLESHKNTHTGEKPFSCNICSFRSGDRSTISKHKKKIHGKDQQIL